MAILAYQGWWMALNAHFRHNPLSHAFAPVPSLLRWLPGSVDGATSVSMMLRVTALFFAFCVASDMSAQYRWRQRIWLTVGLAGTSIVLLGLLQRASDAPMIFWEKRPTISPFFATYYYGGNAGSYINLVFPLVLGLAAMAIRDPDAHAKRSLWIASSFLCLAGAAVNVSRTAQIITGCVLVIHLLREGRRLARGEWLPSRTFLILYAALAVVVVAGLAVFTGLDKPIHKWELLQRQVNGQNPRWLALHACMRMLPDAGFCGLGPGTFEIAFPHYTYGLDKMIAGIWRYAHDDYLQTILEWGLIGAFFWAVFFFGALLKCCAGAWFHAKPGFVGDSTLLFCAGLALAGVAIHALVDFPLQIASLQVYVAAYMGLAWSSGLWQPAELPAPPSRGPRRFR